MEKSGAPTRKLSGPNPLNGVSQLSAEARFLRNASRLRQRGATTPHPNTPILLLLMRLFHSKPTRAAAHRSFAVSDRRRHFVVARNRHATLNVLCDGTLPPFWRFPSFQPLGGVRRGTVWLARLPGSN